MWKRGIFQNKILNKSLIKIFLCLFLFKGAYSKLSVPEPIYDKGDREIILFLSTKCQYCYEAVNKLSMWLISDPSVRVRVFFYAKHYEDQKIAKWLHSSEKDIVAIKIIMDFAKNRAGDLSDEEIENLLKTKHKKKAGEIIKFFKENKDKLIVWQLEVNKLFKCKNISGTPTWLTKNKKFEGIPKNLNFLTQ